MHSTPQWQPPEVPLPDARGRGDVWSIGAVVHVMCHDGVGPVDVARRLRSVNDKTCSELLAAR
jgi:serine/threonine protein kinase